MKTCAICKVGKPETDFPSFFHKQVGRKVLNSRCRPCNREYYRIYDRTKRPKTYHAEWRKKRSDERKREAISCARCGKAFMRMELTQKSLHCKPCYVEKLKEQDVIRRSRPEAREKKRLAVKAWREKNPDRARANDYKKHGIPADAFDKLNAIQGGKCAICGGAGNGKKRLAVDHDHETGKVRGLLCGWCNRGLGYFRDEHSLLSKAIAYLSAHK